MGYTKNNSKIVPTVEALLGGMVLQKVLWNFSLLAGLWKLWLERNKHVLRIEVIMKTK